MTDSGPIDPPARRRLNKPLVTAIAFGIIAATVEMAVLLWFLYG